MRTSVVTSATGEPISLGDTKRHLRLSTATGIEDTLLNGFITASRVKAEDYIGRKLLTQTHRYYLDKWSTGEYIEIPYPPLLAIQSSCLTYKDTTGDTQQVWSTGDSQWEIDKVSEPGRLHLKYGEDWPTDTLWNNNPITIQFICGYGTTDAGDATEVPEPIKLGMKLLIGHWYENRENSFVGGPGQHIVEIPEGTKALWYPYRIWRFEGWD